KEVKGKKGKEKFTHEATPNDVSADQFDAVVIPGGYSPDHLRTDDGIVALVQKVNGADKPVAAICHAGSLLVEADAVRGKRVTTTRATSAWLSARRAASSLSATR